MGRRLRGWSSMKRLKLATGKRMDFEPLVAAWFVPRRPAVGAFTD
jgi:hypothetical protein